MVILCCPVWLVVGGFFVTGSPCVAQDGLELLIRLLQLRQYWSRWHVPPHLAHLLCPGSLEGLLSTLEWTLLPSFLLFLLIFPSHPSTPFLPFALGIGP